MSAGEDMKKLELLHTAGMRQDGVFIMENSMKAPQTLKIGHDNVWDGYLLQRVEIEIAKRH